MVTILLALAGSYTAAVAAIYFFQDRLIYPAPQGGGRSVPGFELVSYSTTDGIELKAGYRAAEAGMPTILYFHGNGADWQSSVVATDRLVPQGYGVLAAEYRGYRGNPGRPSEGGLYRDGRAAMAWLAERGLGAADVVIVGNSIGSGVATQLAIEFEPRALVLISPFTSLPHVVGEQIRWAPTNWLLCGRYANFEKIGDVTAPVLLLHGDADTLVPVHHSQTLAGINTQARLVVVPGAGHELAWTDEAEAATLEFLNSIAVR